MPVFVVSDGRVVEFPDADVAKMAAHGNCIFVIRGEEIVGSFPTKSVRYFGTELPPSFSKDFENQKAWEALPPEERAKLKAEVKAQRTGGA